MWHDILGFTVFFKSIINNVNFKSQINAIPCFKLIFSRLFPHGSGQSKRLGLIALVFLSHNLSRLTGRWSLSIQQSVSVFVLFPDRSSSFTKMSDTSSLENSHEEFSDNNDEEYAVEVEEFDLQNAVAEIISLDQRGIIIPHAASLSLTKFGQLDIGNVGG